MKGIKGKVITITSAKGGVGKTIFATNLAGVYSYLKKRVLLMDMDLYAGGVSVLLNLDKAKTIYNLCDDLINNRFKNSSDYVYNYNEYVDVIPSCKDPRQGNKIDSKIIDQIINLYRNNYDVVIIDTTHISIMPTLVSLDNADEIVFMMTDNPLDLKNSANLLNILSDVGKKVDVFLNLSYRNDKTYFSKFDIKSVIKHNIDFILTQSMYINNINKFMMDGKILILNNKLSFDKDSDRDLMIKIANRLVGDDNEK